MCKLNLRNKGRRMDPCLIEFIKRLKLMFQPHIKILACCCGHGKYPLTIVIRNTSYEGENTWDLFSGKYILRKERFYKRDKQGYYYIPETLENEN